MMAVNTLTDDADAFRGAGLERNAISLPAELQIKYQIVKDLTAPCMRDRCRDKHVVTIALTKRSGRRVDHILLRTFFYSSYNDASRQYRNLIKQLM